MFLIEQYFGTNNLRVDIVSIEQFYYWNGDFIELSVLKRRINDTLFQQPGSYGNGFPRIGLWHGRTQLALDIERMCHQQVHRGLNKGIVV